MTATRTARTELARTALDSTHDATVLVTGCVVLLLADEHLPATWSTPARLLTAAVAALLAAAAASGMLDAAIAPWRRRLNRTLYPPYAHDMLPAPVAATAAEALEQLTAATITDAATRAAARAHTLDHGTYLHCADRWTGYSDGTATFYLAPGLILRFATTRTRYGTDDHYTLLTCDSDQPQEVTSLARLRLYLAARAAGLRAATEPPPADPLAPQAPAAVPHPDGDPNRHPGGRRDTATLPTPRAPLALTAPRRPGPVHTGPLKGAL